MLAIFFVGRLRRVFVLMFSGRIGRRILSKRGVVEFRGNIRFLWSFKRVDLKGVLANFLSCRFCRRLQKSMPNRYMPNLVPKVCGRNVLVFMFAYVWHVGRFDDGISR